MNFIYVIHLLYWNHLTDLITPDHTQRPLLLFLLPLLFLLLLLFLLCVIRSVRWFQFNKWMT